MQNANNLANAIVYYLLRLFPFEKFLCSSFSEHVCTRMCMFILCNLLSLRYYFLNAYVDCLLKLVLIYIFHIH